MPRPFRTLRLGRSIEGNPHGRRELRLSLAAALLCAAAAPPSAPVTISTKPFIAEGIAADPRGHFLVSGVFGRDILRIDARARPWLRPGRLAPVGALFGMAADAKRDRLWGSRYVFIARSQWGAVGDKGRMAANPLPAILAAIDLDPG